MSIERKQFGAYEVIRTLGVGGMGVVYEARHRRLNKRVAVKVLHQERAENRDLVERFLNEARATNEIRHSGVVKIFDADRLKDGTPFLIMEYVSGHTLAEYLLHKKIVDLADLLSFGEQLADTLDAAHRHSVIHRDLKPENIMLVPKGEPVPMLTTKILDFGIAKLTRALGGGKTQAEFLGTPRYASPEQIQSAADVTHKSDVYSLGCILYECACGEVPFDAPTALPIMMAHISKQPQRLNERTSAIGVEFADLIDQMLEKNPNDRPSMATVARILREIRERAAEKTRIYVGDIPQVQTNPAVGSRNLILPNEFSVGFTIPDSGGTSRSSPSKEYPVAVFQRLRKRIGLLGLGGSAIALLFLLILPFALIKKKGAQQSGTNPTALPTVTSPPLLWETCTVVASPADASLTLQDGTVLGLGTGAVLRPKGSPPVRVRIAAEHHAEQVVEVDDTCQGMLSVSLAQNEPIPPPSTPKRTRSRPVVF